MIIGVRETPKVAARVYAVEVDGLPITYSFRALIGPAGWCDYYPHDGISPYTGDPRRAVGHTRAWVYGKRHLIELVPEIVTPDWSIDDGVIAQIEDAAARQRGQP